MDYEEEEYARSFDLKTWRRLLPFMRPYRGMMLVIIALMIVCALFDILLPLFQKYAINNFIEKKTVSGIVLFAIVYVCVILTQTICVILFTRRSMKVDLRLGRDLKRAQFTHLQTLSFSYYNATPVGYILTRVMSDTGRISSLIAWNMPDILWATFYVVGVLIAMLSLNVQLALFVILIVPALAILTFFFQNRIVKWNRKVRRINSKITSAYNEGIMGAKTSKTLVIEDKNHGEFTAVLQSMRIASIKAARQSAIFISLVILLSSFATAIVLAHGGDMVLHHVMLIGTLSAFTSYAIGIFEPIQQLARNFSEIIAVQTNIERVMGLLDKKPDITDTPAVIKKYGDCFNPKRENWEPLRGDIEFRDITFRYPDGGDNVIEHFNLNIPAGTTVAIVGETGAGKSTLVNLACRFFEPNSGQVLIDGRDYRERSQLWLHSNIGYVLQNPHLFSGSVMENIRYGRLDATDEEVRRAAEAVSADTVVNKLENGYDSDVGEGGDRLSTGEKQLISFARAVLANPAIFVLDEATSSIDTQTEQLIQKAIAHILRDRTSFLIAHRLSTIRHADLILVIKDGSVVEQGTHRELLMRQGYYHTLYSKQFAEESAAQVFSGT